VAHPHPTDSRQGEFQRCPTCGTVRHVDRAHELFLKAESARRDAAATRFESLALRQELRLLAEDRRSR